MSGYLNPLVPGKSYRKRTGRGGWVTLFWGGEGAERYILTWGGFRLLSPLVLRGGRPSQHGGDAVLPIHPPETRTPLITQKWWLMGNMGGGVLLGRGPRVLLVPKRSHGGCCRDLVPHGGGGGGQSLLTRAKGDGCPPQPVGGGCPPPWHPGGGGAAGPPARRPGREDRIGAGGCSLLLPALVVPPPAGGGTLWWGLCPLAPQPL